MRESWRWFGQFVTIPLDQIRQTGAQAIVSALLRSLTVSFGLMKPLRSEKVKSRQRALAGML